MGSQLNENMVISPAGIALIKKWEGWYPKAYKDPVGVWTIGWGTTGAEAVPGRKITKKQGEEFLYRDLKDEEATVRSLVKVKLTQHQFDALVSFVYNLGAGNFERSTLLKMINRGNFLGAAAQFVRWNKARSRDTGKWMTLKGLTNRRKDEAALFMLPDNDDTAAMAAASEEIANQPEMDDPNSQEGGVMAEAPSKNENALEEIIKSSDTIKLLILSISSLGAAVTKMAEPLFKDPVTAVAVVVAGLSLAGLFYVKLRDTSEGR